MSGLSQASATLALLRQEITYPGRIPDAGHIEIDVRLSLVLVYNLQDI